MATAIRLPSGSWRVQIYKKVNGRVIRKSITAPTKKEAERLAALWSAQQEEEMTKGETLQMIFDEYISTCKAQGLSPTTIMEYTSRSKASFVELLDDSIDGITTADVQKVLDRRAQNVSPKTLRNDLSFLRAAMSSRNHSIQFDKIKIAKRKKRKKLEMKDEWRTQIPAKAAEIWGKDEYYVYLLLLIFAGLRPSESHALTWKDISKTPDKIGNCKIGYISVSKATVRTVDGEYSEKGTKTESGIRNVVVPWQLVAEITSVLPRKKDEDPIFKTSPYTKDRRWKRLAEELDLPDEMRRYDLRHYFATSLVTSGATEEELQQQMGHSTSSFSHSVYVEIMQDHQKDVTESFAKMSAESLENLSKMNQGK